MGTRQEWTFIGISIDTEPTKVLTWSALQTTPGPDEGGTIPTTFGIAPAIEITRIYKDAKFFVVDGDVTTTQVTITGSGFNDPVPIKIDLKVVSRETTAPTAGAPGTAIIWPFYCTLEDVKDKLVSVDKLFGTNGKLTDDVLLNHISLSYADIHTAAAIGGYAVPITNGNVTTLSAGPSLSAVPVALGIVDISKLDIGDIAFIHGASGTAYLAEFQGIVNIDTVAETAVVMRLRNAYDSGATIESCTEAFKMFRQCNAIAAALEAMSSVTAGQSIGKNDKVTFLEGILKSCLEGLREGSIFIDGLAKKSGGGIKSYQTENPNADDVKFSPVFSLDMDS